MTKPIVTIIYALLFLTPVHLSFAQDRSRPELSGEFELESDNASEDPYTAGQRRSLEYFEALSSATKSLPESGNAELKSLDDNAILYMNAVYLYCTTQKGTCKMVLDALLEGEIMSSKLKGSAECPTLTKFWKSWIKNEMERREEFMISTGLMRTVQDFTRDVRPRYIRCQAAVENEIGTGTDKLQYFKARYAAESSQAKAVNDTAELLRLIKEKMPNLYGTIGLQIDRGQDSGDRGSGAKSGSNQRGSTAKRTVKH